MAAGVHLPLIRVVQIGEGHLAWLSPAELDRVRHLAEPCQDPDDVPSAVLALLLEAFFLSEDVKPLRAVYGHADLSGHREWVSILKAGGDVGQLGKTFTLVVNKQRSFSISAEGWPAVPGGSPTPPALGCSSRPPSAQPGGT